MARDELQNGREDKRPLYVGRRRETISLQAVRIFEVCEAQPSLDWLWSRAVQLSLPVGTWKSRDEAKSLSRFVELHSQLQNQHPRVKPMKFGRWQSEKSNYQIPSRSHHDVRVLTLG